MLVEDGATLTLAGTLTNTGTISIAAAGTADIRLQTRIDYQPGLKDSAATRKIILSGDGSIVLSDNAGNLISATHASDILENDSTIAGAGSIGGGSAMTVQNGGVIDATGTNALIVDIGAGKFTNRAAGTLEGSGSGGLSLSGGGFKNSGLIEALDGSSVSVGADATLTNDAGGVLTGGHYAVLDTGDGATLSIASGPAVATLDAVVELRDTGSVLQTGGETLEDSLTTVAKSGRLELEAGRGWAGAKALTVDGEVLLQGTAFSAPSLTVASGGQVKGYGTIAATLADAGLVETAGGTLVLTGALSGAGVVEVTAQDTLELAQAAPAGLDVTFGGGIHATLKLDDAAGFHATLDSWAHGDTLDLANTAATAAAISGNTLAITLSGGTVLDYTLANPPTGQRIALSTDGAGGTDLTLYAAKTNAAAPLVQSAAAWTAAQGADALHPTTPTSSTAPIIAIAHG